MDLYMRITANPPINGDSTSKAFSNEFELYSMSYGAVNPGGKATLTPITVTLPNYNGPRLLSALATGKPFEVRLTVASFNDKGQPIAFETIFLSGATISSFREVVNAGDGRPVLELALAYTGMEYSQADTGGFKFTYSKGGRP